MADMDIPQNNQIAPAVGLCYEYFGKCSCDSLLVPFILPCRLRNNTENCFTGIINISVCFYAALSVINPAAGIF
jgi:hypothetical protein